ncbi:MAG: response regulator [Candidatus Omnitrophica bacterium]|nr:response regulator [Candidatus Omnitrophota bacterium]
MSFAENLKKIRKGQKLTQHELARKLGLAQSTIGMWEAGHRTPKLDELDRLATTLEIGIEKLIGRTRRIDIERDEIFIDGKKVEELNDIDINEILKHITKLKYCKKTSADIAPFENKPATKTILIIDDEEEICDALHSFLVPQNYKVFLAFNGQMGLEYFNEVKPDAILLDLNMPDMNGKDVLKKIRQKSDVPVIVITAHPEDIADIHLEDLNITGYLEKPFPLSEVLNMLKQLLGE